MAETRIGIESVCNSGQAHDELKRDDHGRGPMGFWDQWFYGTSPLPPDPPALRQAIDKAMGLLNKAIAAHAASWYVADGAWKINQEEKTLAFEMPNGVRATSPAQVIGTHETATGIWRWAWDDPAISLALVKNSKTVQVFGRKYHFPRLTRRAYKSTEQQCWEMMALAYLLCQANGAYRGLTPTQSIFMTFGEIKLTRTR